MTWLLGGTRYMPATSPWDILAPPRDPFVTGEVPEFREGAVKSFGLGTMLRGAQIPEGAPTHRHRGLFFEESEDEFLQRREEAGAITEEEWKGSEFFREGIPFDLRMTRERAAALADWHDESRYRQLVSSERQGFLSNAVGFFAGLGGQALDPINYIPAIGPATRAAQVARFGTIGGRATSASMDAALNTALFGAATMPTRGSFGDDVSAEAFIAEIAGAALIGSAFGGTTGFVARLRESRAANTLQRQAEARAMLDEAVSAIVHDRPVSLSGEATARIQDMPLQFRAEVNRAAFDASPREAIDAAMQARAGDTAGQLDIVDRQIAMNRTARDAIVKEMASQELSQVRAQMIAVERLAEDIARLESAKAKQTNEKDIARLESRVNEKQAEARAILRRLDDEKVQRIEELEGASRLRASALDELNAKRAELAPKVEAAKAEARQQYWQEQALRDQQAREAQAVIDGARITYEHPADILLPDTIAWKPRTVPVEPPPANLIPVEQLARATRNLTRSERADEIVRAVDDDVLNAEIARLRDSGRLTEADERALAEVIEIEQKAEAYNKAMEAAAMCRVA